MKNGVSSKNSAHPTKRMNLLILCKSQFGSHIDTFFYCKYLRKNHNVTYLCWDYWRPKQNLPDVKIVYVSRIGNILIRNINFLKAAIKYLHNNSVDVCFIKYFNGCHILRLLYPKTVFVFDIRTGSIVQNIFSRRLYNVCLRFESMFFKNVTVISKSLAQRFWLAKKATILPLGSIPLSRVRKTFENLKLVYVGTLQGRNIEKTIYGFAEFLNSNDSNIECSYTIVGDGFSGEVDRFRLLCKELKIDDKVTLVGRVPFDQLSEYFDSHNVGISFVPMIPVYDVQPVTKTFDYLLSGMPVIGTATSENKLVINKNNGLLIEDTSESFAAGLVEFLTIKDQFSSEEILTNSMKYHWERIVTDLEAYFESCSEKSEYK